MELQHEALFFTLALGALSASRAVVNENPAVSASGAP